MLQKLEKLKCEVQELQRDLTLRRCLTRRSAVPDLKESISTIEQQLQVHRDTIEQKQPVLEKVSVIYNYLFNPYSTQTTHSGKGLLYLL